MIWFCVFLEEGGVSILGQGAGWRERGVILKGVVRSTCTTGPVAFVASLANFGFSR